MTRVHAGVPAGGQYAATSHAEPGLTLTAPNPVDTDTQIAALTAKRQSAERALRWTHGSEEILRLKADIDGIDGQIDELESGYAQAPWNRYFMVPRGHLHSSAHCGSLQSRTQLGLVPALSGKDEGTAVAEEGTLLCSHCFPDAPSEYTKPKAKDPADYCAGSGQPPTEYRRGTSEWMDGQCSVCGNWQRGSGATGVRKHKAPKK